MGIIFSFILGGGSFEICEREHGKSERGRTREKYKGLSEGPHDKAFMSGVSTRTAAPRKARSAGCS